MIRGAKKQVRALVDACTVSVGMLATNHVNLSTLSVGSARSAGGCSPLSPGRRSHLESLREKNAKHIVNLSLGDDWEQVHLPSLETI